MEFDSARRSPVAARPASASASAHNSINPNQFYLRTFPSYPPGVNRSSATWMTRDQQRAPAATQCRSQRADQRDPRTRPSARRTPRGRCNAHDPTRDEMDRRGDADRTERHVGQRGRRHLLLSGRPRPVTHGAGPLPEGQRAMKLESGGDAQPPALLPRRQRSAQRRICCTPAPKRPWRKTRARPAAPSSERKPALRAVQALLIKLT